MGPIGLPEMMAIAVLALLLFGPKKLPELGRMLAKGLTEFRRAKNELKTTFETHMRELEREVQVNERPSLPPASNTTSTYSYPEQDYGHYDPEYQADYEPYTTQTSNGDGSEPSPASATAPQDAPAYQEKLDTPAQPPAGAIPRSNGFHSSASEPTPAEEHHPAA
ncbi:MAG TPA: twin-arginine translocase TatA/TatE family subunit [Bryobacteraceae bacterium]|jgi:TatA/E family protein of Tat protein translocase|nr:twin-arginine translocase TatA/TatE family subunit [Bryobacteraceae bacterium]